MIEEPLLNTYLQLRLSALNSTKTAFASFVCEKELFFEAYSFNVRRDIRSSSGSTAGDRFYCQILLKVGIFEFLERTSDLTDNPGASVCFPRKSGPEQGHGRGAL